MMMHVPVCVCALALSAAPANAAPADSVIPPGAYFTIQVVDDQTGRGIPLVELQTVNNIRYVTDSHGIVAFDEPGLMDQRVFFFVKSHGYEFPKDGFGYRGKALDVRRGGNATLKMHRVNVAQRLYRMTGGGIYRDSLLTGHPVPVRRPALNGQVLGSDSVQTAVYHGLVYWFWGDTNRPSYPLGNFHMPGATSLLPSDGGLDPMVGVDLTYFVDGDGFAKPMAKMPGEGPTWLDGFTVLRNADGQEVLFARYVKIRAPMTVYEQGLVRFNDQAKSFEKVQVFDMDAPLVPFGHPLKHTVDGVEYVYFADPYPLVRVRATVDDFQRLDQYEAYTCLQPGSRMDDPQIDRGPDGAVRYGWKQDTPAVGAAEQRKLIAAGKLEASEALLQLRDHATGKPVFAHRGTAYFNEHRRRWILIATESGGTSFLGEVWYAEADTPLGPWVYATKIVTHDKYSFYNPKRHPMFDRDGGRTVFFEGTYTHTFSGNPDQTPRYDYNQIMYSLDLDDPRLVLPVPVYRVGEGAAGRFATGAEVAVKDPTPRIAFFALDRPRDGAVPVYQRQSDEGGCRLNVGEPSTGRPSTGDRAKPLFYAVAVDAGGKPEGTQPLYEFVGKGDARVYSSDADAAMDGFQRSDSPICYVWKRGREAKQVRP